VGSWIFFFQNYKKNPPKNVAESQQLIFLPFFIFFSILLLSRDSYGAVESGAIPPKYPEEDEGGYRLRFSLCGFST